MIELLFKGACLTQIEKRLGKKSSCQGAAIYFLPTSFAAFGIWDELLNADNFKNLRQNFEFAGHLQTGILLQKWKEFLSDLFPVGSKQIGFLGLLRAGYNLLAGALIGLVFHISLSVPSASYLAKILREVTCTRFVKKAQSTGTMSGAQ